MRIPVWSLVVLPPLFWAGNFVLGRALHADIPPLALAFWRWVGALAILLPFSLGRMRAQWPQARGRWPILGLLALLGVTSYNTCAYLGLQTTTATNGALLTSTTPIMILGLSFLLLRERVEVARVVGILLSMLGVLVILTQGTYARFAPVALNAGDLWILAASLSWALYSVCLRWRPPDLDPLVFLTLLVMMGLPPLLPLYLWELSSGRGFALSWVNVSAIGYVACFPSVLAYVLWNRAVETLGANRTGQFIHLMPAFAVLLAMVLLGERPSGFQGIGIGCILTGIWLASARR